MGTFYHQNVAIKSRAESSSLELCRDEATKSCRRQANAVVGVHRKKIPGWVVLGVRPIREFKGCAANAVFSR